MCLMRSSSTTATLPVLRRFIIYSFCATLDSQLSSPWTPHMTGLVDTLLSWPSALLLTFSLCILGLSYLMTWGPGRLWLLFGLLISLCALIAGFAAWWLLLL